MSSGKELITNRSEIVFIYDVKDGNPNGDPADFNKPRVDELSGLNIVTDVRLKRTIRNYLEKYKKLEIFVKRDYNRTRYTKTTKYNVEDLNNPDEILEYIDVRLFGGLIQIEKQNRMKILTEKEKNVIDVETVAYTGPVQFNMGRSYHRVDRTYIKGINAFPSQNGGVQQSFREEWILPYSLIGFYGIINENAAKHTRLTKEDVDLLFEAIWNGTKNLITRTKMLHTPRLLLQVEMKEKNYHIGELQKKIKLVTDCEDEEIRDIDDFQLDTTQLVTTLKKENEKQKILRIRFKTDEDVQFVFKGKLASLKEVLSTVGCKVEEFQF